MKRGRVHPHHPGEQVREEPLRLWQERAFALPAPQLLEEGQGDDLRVRESLYGFVAPSAMGVKVGVSVVDEAEEALTVLFCLGEAWGMVGSGHL